MQRILGDDRVVARVDGYSKADGVKGEQIIDLMPANHQPNSCRLVPRYSPPLLPVSHVNSLRARRQATVVRTTSVGYPRDTKLLLLHNNKLVDATVLHWLGGTDHQVPLRGTLK